MNFIAFGDVECLNCIECCFGSIFVCKPQFHQQWQCAQTGHPLTLPNTVKMYDMKSHVSVSVCQLTFLDHQAHSFLMKFLCHNFVNYWCETLAKWEDNSKTINCQFSWILALICFTRPSVINIGQPIYPIHHDIHSSVPKKKKMTVA